MQNIVNHDKNIVEVKDISFSYGRNDVLKNINLEVHQGDYLGVVGPNGGGKTTLLKIMLGILKPAAGSVKLFGVDIKNFKDWYKIGYVPQKATNFDVNFPVTVFDVAMMGRYGTMPLCCGVDDKDKKLVKEALMRVGMWEHRNKLIGDLSGGQQQRVFIARALSSNPEIIFLDEPTTNVDQEMREEFYSFLKKLNEHHKLTLVLVSHDIGKITEEVMHIACIDTTLVCHTSPLEFLKESQSKNLLGQDVKIITPHKHNH